MLHAKEEKNEVEGGDAAEKKEEVQLKKKREEGKNIEPEDEVFKKNRRCRNTKKSVDPFGTTD